VAQFWSLGVIGYVKTISIVALVLLVCFAGCIYSGHKTLWQFDHLEQNARKVITGSELQTWATNLLARYPMETNLSISALGTNFPQRLRGIASPRLGPDVFIHVHDTNYPSSYVPNESYVQLVWGSGFLGGAGFVVGSTNFILGFGHQWQPGVYFYKGE
jgi:hypothetical protein